MKIESLQQLKALLKLAKSNGVESMEVDGIKFYINPNLIAQPIKPSKKQIQLTQHKIDTPDAISEEDMLFWSATGQPQS